MRIRQVRPEFWSDATLGRLSDAVRLFYVGLWNMADDAGWLTWEPDQAGALLYPYKPPTKRVREIEEWIDQLAAAERVVRYDCGCVEVPNLPKHQRISGVQSTRARDLHRDDHKSAKRSPLSDKQSPRSGSDKQSPLSDSPVTVGNGKGGYGTLGEGRQDAQQPSRARLGIAVVRGRVNPLGRPA